MTASTDFDRVVSSWLETSGPFDPPPTLLEDGLAGARRVQQRRGLAAALAGPSPWPPAGIARLRHAPMPMRLALVAMLLLAALGAVGLAGSWFDEQSVPTPAVTPTVVPSAVAPSVAPSAIAPSAGPSDAAPAPSLPASGPATGLAAPEGVRGTWIGANPGVAELNASNPTITLLIDLKGERSWVATTDIGWSGSLRWASQVDVPAPGEIRLTSLQDGNGCRTGDAGRYRPTVSADGATMTLAALSDACAARAMALSQAWSRTLSGPNLGGRGRVDGVEPPFIVTLPPGAYTATFAAGAVDIHDPVYDGGLLRWFGMVRDPQVFADPCVYATRKVLPAGADAFVQHFRETRGWTVRSVEERSIGGHPATRLELYANGDVTCRDGHTYEFIPGMEQGTANYLAPGDVDVLYVTEVGDTTLLFPVRAADLETERAIIDSIEFLEASPTP